MDAVETNVCCCGTKVVDIGVEVGVFGLKGALVLEDVVAVED